MLAFAAGSASAASPTLSIKSSKRIVAYTRAVAISGRLSTGQADATVVLQADRFPFDAFKTVASTTTSEDGTYSFRRKPTLGTRFRVVLGADPQVRSRVVIVYLNALQKVVSCN